MGTIKKGDSSIDVVFRDEGHYTNKLFARNVKFNNGKLEIDFSHYSKRKRNNNEDTDFQKILKNTDNISHLVIHDETIQKKLNTVQVENVTLELTNEVRVESAVSSYDSDIGFLRFKF
ncbi:hypothetical protein [uncultured Desulfuromusa sp.]|uniref:hypothetical protein n=1 Tax=uncultured Desulfuromusa sp. TaxID=219183 RepID=UPI002AA83825|nr:hypothetical protein [uncultured Desulfuromusa sp.]